MQGPNSAELLERNHLFSVELRKQKRSEQANTKRTRLSKTREPGPVLSERILSVFPQLRDMEDSHRLATLRSTLARETDSEKVYLALQCTRLLIRKDSPIGDCTALDTLPFVLRHIDPRVSPSDVVYQAAFLLCDLAAGSHEVATAIVDYGGIEALVRVLEVDKQDMQECALWGLGNVCADCEEYRQLVVGKGMVGLVYELIAGKHTDVTFLKAVAWSLAMLVQFPINLRPVDCQTAIQTVKELLSYRDFDIKKDALQALCSLTMQPKDHFTHISLQSLLPIVVDSLSFDIVSLNFAALRIIGNLTFSDNEYIGELLALSVLSKLQPFLRSPNARIRKEVAWTLANIAAGTQDQAQALFKHPICQDALGGLRDPGYKVALETSYVFRNLASRLSPESVSRLVDMKIVSYFQEVFERKEPDTQLNCLLVLSTLLSAGEREAEATGLPNQVIRAVEETKCLEALERLQQKDRQDLGKCAGDLVDRYFGVVPEFEDVGAEQRPPLFQFS